MNERPYVGLKAALAILTVILFVVGANAATETVLYNFSVGAGGSYPYASLVFDAAGNLYGTTEEGGIYDQGVVFELTLKADGGWTKKVVHMFNPNARDGALPYAGLIIDKVGDLYGTTALGGDLACNEGFGCGIVFELTPKGNGDWKETVLYRFNGANGFQPLGNVVFDGAGNLYGTTAVGGAYGDGTVFELMPKAGGGWTERVLHNFDRGTNDGVSPYAGVILDSTGNLYGTTVGGGTYDWGTVFELTPKAGGGWKEKILHNFNNNHKDGAAPQASLVFDALGNLYGTTRVGGSAGGCSTEGCGTVFELTPEADGGWTEKVVHTFRFNGADGHFPTASLILDASDNLYGTTLAGGTHNDGTAFELTPKADGVWTEVVLHSFYLNHGTDGTSPSAGLIFDASGNLYGTTSEGGTGTCKYGCGTAFEITP
jgi:uncharacterized repeat protein (TIGR03803 family)